MGHQDDDNKTFGTFHKDSLLPFVTSTIIIAVLGVGSNILLLWVWLGEKKVTVTPFLFKYLAVCDIVYLFALPFSCGYYYGTREVTLSAGNSEIAHHISSVGQMTSVHMNLLICISRWIAVVYPLHVKAWLSVWRVSAACLVVFSWCILLVVGHVWYDGGGTDGRNYFERYEIIERFVGRTLPVTVSVCFSVRLLRAFLHHERKMTGISHNKSIPERCGRRVVVPVMVISFTSFLAYPVCDVILLVAHKYGNVAYFNGLPFIAIVLQMFNSSISCCVHWGSSARFRELMAERLKCGRRESFSVGWKRVSPARGRTTTAARGSSVPASTGTFSRTPSSVVRFA